MSRPLRAEPLSGPDETLFPDARRAATDGARRNACAHCGRPFGLVRHRLATKQFCSKMCLAAETDKMQRALKDKVRRFAHLPDRG